MKLLSQYKEAWLSTAPTLAIYGTIGSGKSNFAAGKILYRAAHEENANFLAMRTNGTTCRGSVWAELLQHIESNNLEDGFEIKDHEMILICTKNGNEIKCLGCNDADKLKSVVNVRGIWLEEGIDFSKKDFTQMHLRMRGTNPAYPQVILTSNKSNPYSWQRSYFFDNDNLKDTLVVETSYLQNPYITKADMARFDAICGEDPAMRTVYLENKWATIKKANPFYWAFDENKHVSKTQIQIDDSLPIHITHDFNRNPYSTCQVWQKQGEHIICIDEICLSGKQSNSDSISSAFASRYAAALAKQNGLFIYGDAAGKSIKDTTVYKDYNDYDVIKSNLAAYLPSLRVPSANPSLRARSMFINRVLSGYYPSINILINPSCSHTIQDFNHIQATAEGSKEKEMQTLNGKQSQKLGHTSDSADYFLTVYFAREFFECINGRAKFNPVFARKLNDPWQASSPRFIKNNSSNFDW